MSATDHTLIKPQEALRLLQSIAARPKKVDKDALAMAISFAQGNTLAMIGEQHGISRQGAAARINRSTPWPVEQIRQKRDELMRAQQEKTRADLIAWSHENPLGTLAEAATEFGVTQHEAAQFLGDRAAQHRMPTPRVSHHRYPTEQLIKDLQQWHADTGQTTASDFTAWATKRDIPGHQTVAKRFGRWSEGLKTAGIEAVAARRTPDARSYTDADLWAAAVEAIAHNQVSTGAAYQQWSSEHPGAPTLSTLMNRLGRSWTELRREVLLILRGTSDLPSDVLKTAMETRDWSKQPTFVPEDQLAFVRQAIEDRGERYLPITEYREWAIHHDAPGPTTIVSRMGGLSWGDIVEAAGGIRSRHAAARFSEDAVLDALTQFRQEHPDGSSYEYIQWREGTNRPSLSTIIFRFGSWPNAQVRAHDADVLGERRSPVLS